MPIESTTARVAYGFKDQSGPAEHERGPYKDLLQTQTGCEKHLSEEKSNSELDDDEAEQILEGVTPPFTLLTTYFGWLVLILFGQLRDILGKIFRPGEYAYLREQNGYAPLNSDFENFSTRRIYGRVRDLFNRPITGVPGRTVRLIERVPLDRHKTTWKFTGAIRECLNLSSYNYLGFADSQGPCASTVAQVIEEYGVGTASPRMECGTLDIHSELEYMVARFVGTESALCVNMGFATNSTTIPALIGEGGLILSDELNHSSIVFGARLSGAHIKVYRHNSIKDLERVLRDSISRGQPQTHCRWKKIMVIVEGLYSMEGSIARLKDILALKEKYKFFLYVDEAHSIG
ncbi:serine palmitoyltransferase component, partial [Gonapodya sp. JEL0774]